MAWAIVKNISKPLPTVIFYTAFLFMTPLAAAEEPKTITIQGYFPTENEDSHILANFPELKNKKVESKKMGGMSSLITTYQFEPEKIDSYFYSVPTLTCSYIPIKPKGLLCDLINKQAIYNKKTKLFVHVSDNVSFEIAERIISAWNSSDDKIKDGHALKYILYNKEGIFELYDEPRCYITAKLKSFLFIDYLKLKERICFMS